MVIFGQNETLKNRDILVSLFSTVFWLAKLAIFDRFILALFWTTVVCTCVNGAAAYGASCPTHNQQFCTGCDTGSTMINNVCVVNVCSCGNGIAPTGENCPAHNQQFCTSCDLGSTMTDNVCVANVCTCNNGVVATGADCTQHNLQCVQKFGPTASIRSFLEPDQKF